LLEVSALVDDRVFADVEDGAVGGAQGQSLHFLHHRQSPPQDRLVPGVHLEQNFRTHPTSFLGGNGDGLTLPISNRHPQRNWLHTVCVVVGRISNPSSSGGKRTDWKSVLLTPSCRVPASTQGKASAAPSASAPAPARACPRPAARRRCTAAGTPT